MERTDAKGDRSEEPASYLEPHLEPGVVREAVFVERTEPEALHSQEMLDEDDSFLSVASEIWEYDVSEGREQDFLKALTRSQMVMDYEEMEDR